VPLLLAEIDLWSSLTNKLRGFTSLDATRLGALASGLAIGVLVIWYYSRWSGRRSPDASPHSPQRLFGELCQAHRLTAAQRRLLEWLVAERQLLQPALVFLDPILLESAIAHAESPGVRKRLIDLRAKLFATQEANAAAEGAALLR
jgi:hypothetical protein